MFSALQIESYRAIWDTIDIVIVALGIYYLLTIIEKTRALRILIGLVFILLLYLVSQYGDLYTLNWILSHFLASIIIITVILFQQDIRRALAGFGKSPVLFRGVASSPDEKAVEEIVKAASLLSNRKIGALIAIEKNTSLADFVEIGMRLDAWVSREIIISIFNHASPIHDGGMIIFGNKILSVGSFFPIATDPDLERELGTRHRAALGLSRETDAVVIVVSEETGKISLAYQGALTRGLDATSLQNRLIDLFELRKAENHELSLIRRVFSFRRKEEKQPHPFEEQ